MKNIVIVVHHLWLWWGIEKVWATLWDLLIENWYNVSYLTFFNLKDKYFFKGHEFCLNENKDSCFLWKIWKLFIRWLKISKYSKKYNIDYVISLWEIPNFSSIISKLFFNKAKIISTVHHSINDYRKGMFYWIIKLLYRYSDNVVVLTEHEHNNLIQNFGCKKNRVIKIPNWININDINHAKNENLWQYKNLFGKLFTFIAIWRLEYVKNYELLINVFNKFNKKYNNTQLLILGDWSLMRSLKRQIYKNIHFLWNQKNVYKFLAKSDCFINTSFSEAFPVSFLEAMACWLPIIATNTQWANEILTNVWFVIDNNSEDILFRAMANIYKDKDMRLFYKKQSIINVNNYLYSNIFLKWENLLS